MANTYTQIYIQYVFVVKRRENLIHRNNRDELEKYITGIIANRGQHHGKKSFKDEYLEYLKEFYVGYDERYLFDWIETGAITK